MKAIFIGSILCFSSMIFSQGLHVEENHTVLFGVDTLGSGVKTMWIPSKGAFRTGGVGTFILDNRDFDDPPTWDPEDIGLFSFATGYGSKASGDYSVSMGIGNVSSGFSSAAIGGQLKSSNFYSIALGIGSTASGRFSTAMGNSNIAQGSSSFAIGNQTVASGLLSFSTGKNTVASGDYSSTHGINSIASGSSSFAIGDSTIAMGPNSVSMGNKTIALTHSEVVLGQYNTEYNSIGYNGGLWIPGDRLFTIGNGIDKNERSDAIVVLKNGKTGIGSSAPSALLEVAGAGDDIGGADGINEVTGYFKNKLENTHSAISIDANKGSDAIIYLAEDKTAIWDLRHDRDDNSAFNIRYQGGTNANSTKLKLDVVGNLTISGTYNPSSDANRKHNIVSIDEGLVLDKISTLPISTWSYKQEEIRHIGPMAQDFYAAFGLGQGETTIATVDADGVALAAIKALNQKVVNQEELILSLSKRLEKLEK